MPSAVVAAPAMTVPSHEPPGPYLAAHRQFKKHKTLPHPRNETHRSPQEPRSAPTEFDLFVNTSGASTSMGSQKSSPRTLKHQSGNIGTGPDLPPTPPNHSRASSGSHSVQPPSPPPPQITVDGPRTSVKRPPVTPPDQRSPPTPDVTPPQPADRPRALRPSIMGRGSTRTVTTDSRTESFKTAREEPLSSEDETAAFTARSRLTSGSTSQATILRAPNGSIANTRAVQPESLTTALERLEQTQDDEPYTPRTYGELALFDGEWTVAGEVQHEWDDNLQRYVAISRRHANPAESRAKRASRTNRIVDDHIVVPTNATETVRTMPLQEKPKTKTSPAKLSPRKTRQRSGAEAPKTPAVAEARKSSGTSTQSTPSTVISAFLVETPSPPQRNRTLRHMKKRRELRESSPERPSRHARPSPPEVTEVKTRSPPRQLTRPPISLQNENSRHRDSTASSSSTNTVSVTRASREVWKTGGVPVVVIPDRRSSNKTSREPSLRSTSSRRSKRTRSVGSTPYDQSPVMEQEPTFARRPRAEHRLSGSAPGEERTIDYAPVVPPRSSSLSAPTSRNVSRTGSLTVESIKALNSLHDEEEKARKVTPTKKSEVASPAIPILMPLSPRSDVSRRAELLGADHDETASAKKFSSRTTPFSIVSGDTNWTALEVSEALAVHMYPHQNSSVLMVNHSSKPSDTSDDTSMPVAQEDAEPKRYQLHDPPRITATAPDGGVVTPPQRRGSLEEVDSPLRNPRAPPEPPAQPPAIKFIPPTPSGTTPAEERTAQLGDGLEDVSRPPPTRRPSLLQRAFSRRRHSISYPPNASKTPGFLTRTFSLSRSSSKSSDSRRAKPKNPDMDPTYGDEDEPVEEDKLHPHWRPQWHNEGECDCDGECRAEGEVYRYPAIDNRPRMRRSLSERMRRTFAVLPMRDDYHYEEPYGQGPEKRTIRRTPSGNLRVMRRFSSQESLKATAEQRRPASEGNSQKGFWRGRSIRRRPSHERLHRRPSSGRRFEAIPDLTRMWSERRREKRTQELRQKISAPTEVRDGIGEVIRMNGARGGLNEHPQRF